MTPKTISHEPRVGIYPCSDENNLLPKEEKSDDNGANSPLSPPNALRIPIKPKKQNDNETSKNTKSPRTKSEELVFEAPEKKNPDHKAFFPE